MAVDEREGRQDDGDRPSQAGPGQDRQLPHLEPEPRHEHTDGEGSGHEDENHGDDDGAPGLAGQLGGRHEQAEQEEEADLCGLAASVDATTAPTSSAVLVSTSSTGRATRATVAMVMPTPAVAMTAAGAPSERIAAHGVGRPPLNRMKSEGSDGYALGPVEIREADLHPSEAVTADGHADGERHQQAGNRSALDQPGTDEAEGEERGGDEDDAVDGQVGIHRCHDGRPIAPPATGLRHRGRTAPPESMPLGSSSP